MWFFFWGGGLCTELCSGVLALVCAGDCFSLDLPSVPWAPTHRITVGYSSPVYRKMQLKEAARQPFPSTAREVRMIVWSREKGMGRVGA